MEGLEDELDALEAEMVGDQMDTGPVAVGTISAPDQAQAQQQPAGKQKSAEDELAAMMAM